MSNKTKTAAQIQSMIKQSIELDVELSKIENSLEKMPTLKKLLQDFESYQEGEFADLSTKSIMYRYFDLKKRGVIKDLFILEYLEKTGDTDGTEWL